MKHNHQPPCWARWLLKCMGQYELRNHSTGDFMESYQEMAEQRGRIKADFWFVSEVLLSMPDYLTQILSSARDVTVSIVRTAWRHLKKERLTAGINITGLALGLAASLLIFLWVLYQMSYDVHHEHVNRLYRVISVKHTGDGVVVPVTPPAAAPAFRSHVTGVEAACRLRRTQRGLARLDEIRAVSTDVVFTESSFFDCFSCRIKAGELPRTFDQSRSVLLSESTAKRMFGDEEALGQSLKLGETVLTVAAVLADEPRPSHLSFEALLPLSLLSQGARPMDLDTWSTLALWTYVKAGKGIDEADLLASLNESLADNSNAAGYEFRLQTVRDIHLRSLEGADPINTIRLYAVLAFLILVVAAINFINLSTARAGRRSLEVGLRKTMGASRPALMLQFIAEAGVQTLLAFAAALILAMLLLPHFNGLTGLELDFTAVVTGGRWIWLFLMPLVISLAAGLYPAWVLSGYRPRQTLMMKNRGRMHGSLRRTLVVGQFILSLLLLMAALGVSDQLNYLLSKPLGLNPQGVIYTDLRLMDSSRYLSLQQALMDHPAVLSATRTNMPLLDLGFETSHNSWEGQRPDQQVNVQIRAAEAQTLATWGMSMAAGRFFEAGRTADEGGSCVLNEAAVRAMGLEKAVGRWFEVMGQRMEIIGVVKDFHHHSLHTAIEPLIFINQHDWSGTLVLRCDMDKWNEAQAHIKSLWPRINPGQPVVLHHYDQALSAHYRAEVSTGKLVWAMGGLAVIVACLGLIGLTLHSVESLKKEIGIRKVLGASAGHIAARISRQYALWVLTAVAIAWPLAHQLLKSWLNQFAYRMSLGWQPFAIGSFMILALALLTVSLLVFRAALVPPVQTLRQE